MSPCNFTNQALIQDETLFAICLVLEHGWPAGPTFLHALNTLIETVVIHDAVYFDPLHQFRRGNLSPNSIPGILRNSDFVNLLVQEEAIREFPMETVVDTHFVTDGRDYTYGRFLADAAWSTDSFAYSSPEEEASRLEIYLELVSRAPRLLQPERLLPPSIRPGSEQVESGLMVGGREILLMMLGRSLSLSNDDLLTIEGMNFRAKAFLDLGRNTGLHLHPFYLALPHQIGAIHQNNSKALELFHKLQDKLNSMQDQEEGVGESGFGRVPIPPLAEVVLGRCKDSKDAIPLELLDLRNVHRGLREYLTDYEQRWNSAPTKREQWKLRVEFDSALKQLLEKETRQSTRVIYMLWDILKEPTKILQALGDKVTKRGRERYIVGRVKGLHDFWDDLSNSPPSNIMRTQFNRLFPKRSEDKTWESGRKLAEAVNAGLSL